MDSNEPLPLPPVTREPVSGSVRAHDRVLGLDVLRGLAAASVVIYHYSTRYDELYGHPRPLAVYWPYGYYGVDLFFMISGFVIFLSLDRAKSVTDFAVARFARVIPSFWAGVILTTIVVRLFALPDGSHGPSTRDVFWNLTLLKSMTRETTVDGVYWTLYCEALFYGIMGVLRWVGLRRYMLGAFAALVLIATINAIPTHFGDDPTHTLFHGLPLWRALNRGLNIQFNFLFLLGMTLYESRRGWRWHHVAIVGLCLLNSLVQRGAPTLAVEVGLFAVAWVAVQTPVLDRPWFVLTYLGLISYPVYLLHQNIGCVLLGHLYRHGLTPALALSIAAVALLAYASLFTFAWERPTNRVIRRWWKSRSGKTLPTPATVGTDL